MTTIRVFVLALTAAVGSYADLPDIRGVPIDLTLPPVTRGQPAAGKRAVQVEPEYKGTAVHHILYLPTDWAPGKRYPVIVEYAGNGPYENEYGDVSTGEVEGSVMGYGLSGGTGFIWLALPFVDPKEGKNQTWWWGDVEATVDYAKRAIRRVCEQFGGDPSAVILTGFSRGAIACNYIGLHDDEIADIWLAFMPYSHYDGVRDWDYAGSSKADARIRLKRLAGRASFVTHERSIDETQRYIEQSGIVAPFTFQAIPYRNHNAGWTLRDISQRATARRWLANVLGERRGAHAIRGLAPDTAAPDTLARGSYELKILTGPKRTIGVHAAGISFTPRGQPLVMANSNAKDVKFVAAAKGSE